MDAYGSGVASSIWIVRAPGIWSVRWHSLSTPPLLPFTLAIVLGVIAVVLMMLALWAATR